jgi:hypothetical protein
MVAGKAGMNEAQADQAVEIMLGFLGNRLPDPMAPNLTRSWMAI